MTYTITAKNAGNVTLYGVTIVDPLVPRLDCGPSTPGHPRARRRPGLHRSNVHPHRPTSTPASLTNIATATGDDPSGREVTGVGTAVIGAVPEVLGEKSNLSPSEPLAGAVAAPTSPAAAADGTPANDGRLGGRLARTGLDFGFWLRLAVLLTVAGVGVGVGTRRKATVTWTTITPP